MPNRPQFPIPALFDLRQTTDVGALILVRHIPNASVQAIVPDAVPALCRFQGQRESAGKKVSIHFYVFH